MNIVTYIRWRYISRLHHRLTEEYKVYPSAITDERAYVSCSDISRAFFFDI
jgi:hypothetical protein